MGAAFSVMLSLNLVAADDRVLLSLSLVEALVEMVVVESLVFFGLRDLVLFLISGNSEMGFFLGEGFGLETGLLRLSSSRDTGVRRESEMGRRNRSRKTAAAMAGKEGKEAMDVSAKGSFNGGGLGKRLIGVTVGVG
ncbi:hypothetical protein HPP92_016348 [Vanilla planifolia]|uniref:Uncharacterized protein n=1 Tax=Vanilla planifolia TaxID=51239 RepID=A0A835QDX5_VANPL|nr:hypothetical protein HPP92_016348 [Vanilla planifolia]